MAAIERQTPRLPLDILHRVLDFIEGDADKFVRPDQRAYLSVEAFGRPPILPPADAGETLRVFRLVCKDFAEQGARYLFAKVAIRFGRTELERLKQIAKHPHLAMQVQKFVYMVPYFYTKDRFDALDVEPHCYLFSKESRSQFRAKAEEQKQIVESSVDKQVVHDALEALGKLHHIQIAGKVGDEEDSRLYHHLRRPDVNLEGAVDLQWEPACTRAMETVTEAWVATGNTCGKFSVNRMSPSTALRLAHPPLPITRSLASRLTNLVLHFDIKDFEMDSTEPLARMLNNMFRSAKGIETVHIGFPPYPPLMPRSLRLEDVFENVRWNRLRSFGIEGWKLSGAEIIKFVSQYRYQLTSVRLRHIGLKGGTDDDELAMWKDVLRWLRDNMERLEWVSLRRIGYTATWEEAQNQMGHEVLDDFPGAPSDDESDDGLYLDDTRSDGITADENMDDTPMTLLQDASTTSLHSSHANMVGQHVSHGADPLSGHSSSSVHAILDADDQSATGSSATYEPIRFDPPGLVLATTRSQSGDLYLTQDALVSMTADDLGDNGIDVREYDWKLWEKWVCARRS